MVTLTGEQVKEYRLRLDFSRRQLADTLNVSTETVRSWETGRRPCEGPAAKLLVMIANGDKADD